MLKADRPDGKFPYVRIRLEDGSTYAGRVQDFSPDLATDDREIVLCPPWLKSKTGDNHLAPVPREVERLVISGSAIRSIAVSYWPEHLISQSSTPPSAASVDSSTGSSKGDSAPSVELGDQNQPTEPTH